MLEAHLLRRPDGVEHPHVAGRDLLVVLHPGFLVARVPELRIVLGPGLQLVEGRLRHVFLESPQRRIAFRRKGCAQGSDLVMKWVGFAVRKAEPLVEASGAFVRAHHLEGQLRRVPIPARRSRATRIAVPTPRPWASGSTEKSQIQRRSPRERREASHADRRPDDLAVEPAEEDEGHGVLAETRAGVLSGAIGERGVLPRIGPRAYASRISKRRATRASSERSASATSMEAPIKRIGEQDLENSCAALRHGRPYPGGPDRGAHSSAGRAHRPPRTPRPRERRFRARQMPGDTMHALLRVSRSRADRPRVHGARRAGDRGARGPRRAFRDEVSFPGHRMYQASFEPAVARAHLRPRSDEPPPDAQAGDACVSLPRRLRFAAEGIARSPTSSSTTSSIASASTSSPGSPRACPTS